MRGVRLKAHYVNGHHIVIVDRVHPIRMQLAELEQRLQQRNNAERQLAEF